MTLIAHILAFHESPVLKLAFASKDTHARASPLHSPRRRRDGTRNDPSRNPRIRRVVALAFPANHHARAGDALARSNPTSSSSSARESRSLLLPNEAPPTLKNAFPDTLLRPSFLTTASSGRARIRDIATPVCVPRRVRVAGMSSHRASRRRPRRARQGARDERGG